MAVSKTFDEILSGMLRDWENQEPDADRSQGSFVFVKSAVFAAALWGLYRFMDWTGKQIFPSTCDSATLDLHAARRGITRLVGEGDAELLARLSARERQPPAGGNKADWAAWAKGCSVLHSQSTGDWTELVKDAWVFEHKRYVGSIDVVISSNQSQAPVWDTGVEYSAGSYCRWGNETYCSQAGGTSSGSSPLNDVGVTWTNATEIPSDGLVASVVDYCENMRPIGLSWGYQIWKPTRLIVNIAITVTGTAMESAEARQELKSIIYENAKLPLEKRLLPAQIISTAIEYGAEDVTDIAPGSTVTPQTGPATWERIWPGTVSVVLEV